MTSVHSQTAALLDAAGRVVEGVRAAGCWSTQAADETLDAVDVLLAELCRIGPEAHDVLTPVQDRLAEFQKQLRVQEKARQEQGPSASRPVRQVPRGAQVPRPGDTPESWINKDEWHAEQVWFMLRRPGAAEEWMRLAALFDALPVKRQREATRLVADTGECWAVVLEGRESPRPELTAMRVSP